MCDHIYKDLPAYPSTHPDFPNGIPKVWCDDGLVIASCHEADCGVIGVCQYCDKGKSFLGLSKTIPIYED